jgi:hypothetical protein
MAWHVGSFSMFAFANILWLIIQVANFNEISPRSTTGYKMNLTAEALTIVCIVMAELPLLHIINSIIAKGIQDQMEEDPDQIEIQSQYD